MFCYTAIVLYKMSDFDKKLKYDKIFSKFKSIRIQISVIHRFVYLIIYIIHF